MGQWACARHSPTSYCLPGMESTLPTLPPLEPQPAFPSLLHLVMTVTFWSWHKHGNSRGWEALSHSRGRVWPGPPCPWLSASLMSGRWPKATTQLGQASCLSPIQIPSDLQWQLWKEKRPGSISLPQARAWQVDLVAEERQPGSQWATHIVSHGLWGPSRKVCTCSVPKGTWK